MSEQGTIQASLEAQFREMTEKVNSVMDELRFHEKGFSFSSVRSRSAKDIFGEHWQYVVGAHLDAEALFDYSQKDQLKPIDVILTSIQSDQPHKIKKGKRVTIDVSAGDVNYNGTHVALWVNDHEIIIPCVRMGDAKGIYQNTEKVESLQNKKAMFERRLTQIQDSIAGSQANEEPKVVTEEKYGEQKKKDNTFVYIQALLALLAVAGITYLFIPSSKIKS